MFQDSFESPPIVRPTYYGRAIVARVIPRDPRLDLLDGRLAVICVPLWNLTGRAVDCLQYDLSFSRRVPRFDRLQIRTRAFAVS